MAQPALEHNPWWKDPDFWKALAVILGIVVPQGFIGGVVRLVPEAYVIVVAYLVALVAFVALLGLMWFKGGKTWRKATLVLLVVGNSLFSGWAGVGVATLLAPAPTQVILDRMDGLSEWTPGQIVGGQAPVISLAPGRTGNAMEMSYTLAKGDWVRVAKEISTAALSGTQGIGFWYEGTGAQNSLEIELMYPPDATGKTPTFQTIWNYATTAANWTPIESRYVSFACWTDTGCAKGETLDPARVAEIQIAVSNKPPADTPGSGALLVDDIYAFP